MSSHANCKRSHKERRGELKEPGWSRWLPGQQKEPGAEKLENAASRLLETPEGMWCCQRLISAQGALLDIEAPGQ